MSSVYISNWSLCSILDQRGRMMNVRDLTDQVKLPQRRQP